MIKVTLVLQRWLEQHGHVSAGANHETCRDATAKALASGDLEPDEYKRLALTSDEPEASMTTTAQKIFGGAKGNGSGGSRIRVRGASEAYSDVRYAAKHAKTGLPVFDECGCEVTRPSQLSLAQSGTYLKHVARRAGIPCEISEADQALFNDLTEQQWASYSGEAHEEKIFVPGSKAPLLDDTTSGGIYASPTVFDDDLITSPLLFNELLPLCDLKPISRGRRIEGASVGTPSVVWNEGDGASGTLFDSSSLIAPVNSTVFDLSAHVVIGLDFLSDAAVDVGATLIPLISERMGEAIEIVISAGNGTTQPSGVMGAAGTNSVSFGGVAATSAKYLELLFSVPKNLRMGANNNFVFCGNEISYRRARAINTGVTGDTRFVFGDDVESYSVLGRRFCIVPSMANSQLFAGAMKRYRLYRRLGTQVTITREGQTLQTKNELLITCRQRWAGRVVLPGAFTTVVNAEG